MADITSSINELTTDYMNQVLSKAAGQTPSLGDSDTGSAFSSILNSAMDMLNNTNTLISNADAAQMNFAMGNSDNVHDLLIAMQKASMSLQYTVAVKNQFVSAYKEIMNIQI